MKKFSDYLEIIIEGKVIRSRQARLPSVKSRSYTPSKIESLSDINKNINKNILNFMNDINKAFKKFKSKYAEQINEEEVFNFDKLGDYLKVLHGTKDGQKINIYNSLNNFDDAEKFYKKIFGDDTKDIENSDFYFKFFALLDQDVSLKNKTIKINMSDEILKKISDAELATSIRIAKDSTIRNKKIFF